MQASRLLNQSFVVMRSLGWAWRWSEHWVESDSSWEPLLEPGQKEHNMTKAQLKIIDSTPESRCADARRCRLAAFGAALRNRCYDDTNGFNNDALKRALRAILNTQSLVGPLLPYEIDFLEDWLGRAYRTKSRLLGFGDDKIPVANDWFCVHRDDKSPKYELGNRPLPGKQHLATGEIFETNVVEVDDFLKPEVREDGEVVDIPRGEIRKEVNYKKSSKAKNRTKAKIEVPAPKKRGRPPKQVAAVAAQPPRRLGRPPKGASGAKKQSPGQPSKPRTSSQYSEEDTQSIYQSAAAFVPSAVRKRKRCISPVDAGPVDDSSGKPPENGKRKKLKKEHDGGGLDYIVERKREVDRPPTKFDFIDPKESIPGQIKTVSGKHYALQPIEFGKSSSQNDPTCLFAIAGRVGISTFKIYGAGRSPRPRHLLVNLVVDEAKFTRHEAPSSSSTGEKDRDGGVNNDMESTKENAAAEGPVDEVELAGATANSEQIDSSNEPPPKEESKTSPDEEVKMKDTTDDQPTERVEVDPAKEKTGTAGPTSSSTCVEEPDPQETTAPTKSSDTAEAGQMQRKKRKRSSFKIMGLDVFDIQSACMDGGGRRRKRSSVPLTEGEVAPDKSESAVAQSQEGSVNVDQQESSSSANQGETTREASSHPTDPTKGKAKGDEDDDLLPLSRLSKRPRLSSPKK